jgi:hypothetical protein
MCKKIIPPCTYEYYTLYYLNNINFREKYMYTCAFEIDPV